VLLCRGVPVISGVMMNHSKFEGEEVDASAGQSEYDHIVTVLEAGDTFAFNDNGLWGGGYPDGNTPRECMTFTYHTKDARTRAQANQPKAPIYSIPNFPDKAKAKRDGCDHFAIALTGVADTTRVCLPVQVVPDIPYALFMSCSLTVCDLFISAPPHLSYIFLSGGQV
jgi:hypothetical protein